MTLSLERRADLWGNRTAVVDATADRRVSYADLEAEADAMARRLAALGVGPGDPVAVVSRNRIETLALLFAVRRLGAIFAPISHRLTPASVEEPLETVSPAVVVHEAAQRDLVREVESDRTHTFEDLGRHEGAEYERADRDPEDALFYLHDEGGGHQDEGGDHHDESGPHHDGDDEQTPSRVVALSERAVEWNCVTAVAAWGLGRGDCAPALVPFSDAAGLYRLTLPMLYVGGRVVVLRAFDPEDALAAVAEEGATALFAGATEYRELVACADFAATDFGSVEWVVTGSALPADAREALARKAPLVRVYGRVETGPNNLYAPAAGWSNDEGTATDDPDCVGRPFPDCEVRIVAEDGTPVTEGEAGELELRGPITATGYLTADGDVEAFSEWVPTGDLAFRDGGDYYLLGSADETFGSGPGCR